MMKKIIAFLFALVLMENVSFAFPVLTGQVVDEARVLSPQTKAKLVSLLQSETQHQVVVATISSLEGKPIEEYALELGRAWQIGEKENNNGVLLVIAPNEGFARIEVGYGLEGVLTDVAAAFIIDKGMKPYLKQKDFDAAVLVGAEHILDIIKNERFNPPQEKDDPTLIQLSAIMLVVGLFFWVAMAPKDERAKRLRLVLFIISLTPRGGRFPKRFKGKGGSFGGGGASGRL